MAKDNQKRKKEISGPAEIYNEFPTQIYPSLPAKNRGARRRIETRMFEKKLWSCTWPRFSKETSRKHCKTIQFTNRHKLLRVCSLVTMVVRIWLLLRSFFVKLLRLLTNPNGVTGATHVRRHNWLEYWNWSYRPTKLPPVVWASHGIVHAIFCWNVGAILILWHACTADIIRLAARGSVWIW